MPKSRSSGLPRPEPSSSDSSTPKPTNASVASENTVFGPAIATYGRPKAVLLPARFGAKGFDVSQPARSFTDGSTAARSATSESQNVQDDASAAALGAHRSGTQVHGAAETHTQAAAGGSTQTQPHSGTTGPRPQLRYAMANLDNRSKQAMTLPAFARMASKLPPGKLATTVSSKPEAASAASSSGGRRRRSSMVVFDESQSPTQQVAAAAAVMSTLASNNMAQAFTPGGHRIEGNLPISQSPLHHLSSSLESSALAGIASDLPATAAIPSSVQGQRGLGSSAILRSVKLAGRRAPHAADPLESGSTPSSSAEPDGALERLRLAAKRTWEAPETANAKNPLETENQRGHAATSSSSPSGSPTVASTNKRVRFAVPEQIPSKTFETHSNALTSEPQQANLFADASAFIQEGEPRPIFLSPVPAAHARPRKSSMRVPVVATELQLSHMPPVDVQEGAAAPKSEVHRSCVVVLAPSTDLVLPNREMSFEPTAAFMLVGEVTAPAAVAADNETPLQERANQLEHAALLMNAPVLPRTAGVDPLFEMDL